MRRTRWSNMYTTRTQEYNLKLKYKVQTARAQYITVITRVQCALQNNEHDVKFVRGMAFLAFKSIATNQVHCAPKISAINFWCKTSACYTRVITASEKN